MKKVICCALVAVMLAAVAMFTPLTTTNTAYAASAVSGAIKSGAVGISSGRAMVQKNAKGRVEQRLKSPVKCTCTCDKVKNHMWVKCTCSIDKTMCGIHSARCDCAAKACLCSKRMWVQEEKAQDNKLKVQCCKTCECSMTEKQKY